MRPFLQLCTLGLVLSAPIASYAQQAAPVEYYGTVQTDAGEPLPGATVFVKGTYIGSTTNSAGTFRLMVPANLIPAPLSVSFVGYLTSTDTLTNTVRPLSIILQPSAAQINEVVVSASRVEENILRAPVTVDKVNTLQLSRLTQPDLITSLARQKGVDVTTSGMFMASLSTRGFGGATSERLVQLVDLMDTQSPSLNINAGNALGLPELDIASVEVLHGPSSALYGANAFNGVVLTNSKSPFEYEGLSVRLRGGNRDYLDGQLRYAQRIGRKFAFKVSGSYASANDWIANNYDALGESYAAGNNPAGSGLGYDAVNRYGDVGNTFGATGGALAGKTVFMPGWTERELIDNDYKAKLYRIVPSVHYLVTDKIKAMIEFKRASGTTAYQFTNRYRFKDFATNQWRAELKSDNWYLRAYQTQDFGANSYDLPFTGAFMQTSVDPNSAAGATYAQQYFQAYAVAYNTFLARNPGNTAGAEAAAQGAANPFQLVPGTPGFEQTRKKVISDATPGIGSRINPSSLLNDISGQYDFKLKAVNLIVGGAYRQYRLGSDGLLFSDRDGKRLVNYEYGGYAQISKELLRNRLKLTAAGRMDDSKNFKPVFSPRASAVYSLDQAQTHNFRASYNQAYRSPTQQGQYLSLDLARVLLLGNISNGFSGYSTAAASQLGRILRNPATAQQELDAYAVNAERLKPERVSTWELGYKGLLLPNLVLDVNYYNSRYNDFIGQIRVISNVDGSKPTVPQMAAAATSARPFQSGTTRVIQVQANANQEVKASGSTVGLTYTALKAFSLTGNYTLNVLHDDNLPESFQTYYNTPKHKYNIGAYGELKKVFNYSVNYRWAQGHLFESPFAAGQLKSYSSLDAQVGYVLPKLHTTLQIGGSNLTNATNIQVYGGPQVGRLVYGGLLFDIK
ncbi:carboxypeptidase-like regulatory domain-containing protein [Hymenobacter sp. DG01]|uniref:TonB-dependent receptor n=1 Tax=Hymenobacter sp. DG01 TaxID=2584940 RepID=UPI00112132DB|nr:carboxypeptidase-like regulatory domain-containing protein [Hymenobacter sp. DG01]